MPSMNYPPKHDLSRPHYRGLLEELEGERKHGVENLTELPFSVGLFSKEIGESARVCIAVDPNAAESFTWEFWTTWMQVAEASFAMSTIPPGETVQRRIDGQVRTLHHLTPGPECNAGTWLTAFSLAVSCRDEERVRFLCQIPVSFIREAGEARGGGHDEYIYPWVAAIQDFILNRPTLGDNLFETMRLAEPEHADISSPEDLSIFVFPAVNALYRLAEKDTDKFNDAMEQGIRLFHDYYTADEERSKSREGAVPLELLGVACLAYDTAQVDPDFHFDVESGYLPKHLLQRSWYGEFPT